MAFVWVQQWVPLPVVYEQQHMGDLPPGPRSYTMDNTTANLARDGNNSTSFPTSLKSPDSNDPFYSQLSSLPQGQLRSDHRSPTHANGTHQPQEYGTSPLNMGAMTGALPNYGTNDSTQMNPQVPRSLSGASTSAVAYQLGQNLQMPSGNMPAHASYGPGYATGLPQQHFMPQQGSQYNAYPSYPTNQPRLAGVAPMHSPYQNYQQASQYMYYPAPYTQQGQFNPAFGAQSHSMYERKASSTNTGMQGHGADYAHVDGGFPGVRMATGNYMGDSSSLMSPYGAQFVQSSSKQSPQPAIAQG